MLYVTFAALAALTVTVVAFVGVLRSMQRAHARREDLLLNQMLNLAGKPWQAPPANDRPEPAEVEPRFWTTNPEQGF